jgi:DNA-directed RNA polymerase specialized sigma24 family protein
MRFILDLSVEETADMLEMSQATVKREWSFARAFLLRELKRDAALLKEECDE